MKRTAFFIFYLMLFWRSFAQIDDKINFSPLYFPSQLPDTQTKLFIFLTDNIIFRCYYKNPSELCYRPENNDIREYKRELDSGFPFYSYKIIQGGVSYEYRDYILEGQGVIISNKQKVSSITLDTKLTEFQKEIAEAFPIPHK